MSAPPVDLAIRDEIRTNLDDNLLVEAGAGTGKTTALVSRIIEVLATGRATADGLVAMTFTEAAAAELSARVREDLERAVTTQKSESRRARLEEALRSLHRARIETIHAFCASLLHERPVEAELDPEFSVLADLEADLSFDSAYQDWLDELLEGRHPEVEEAFNLGLSLNLFRACAEVLHRFRYLLPLADYDEPGGTVDDVTDWLDENVAELEAIKNRCIDDTDPLYGYVENLLAFKDRIEVEGTTPAARARVVATGMPRITRNKGRASSFSDAGDANRLKNELFVEWQALAGSAPAALRSRALLNLIPHVERFVLDYQNARRAAGVADFDDILIWARDLLRGRIEVRRYFQERFSAILIDEFQDTDPIQAEIAMLLASDDQDGEDWRELEPTPGKLFVVGDPKQSIYRFRRADIGIYDEIKRNRLSNGIRTITQNFRSVEPVLDWVNSVFDVLFVEEQGVQPANVPLQPSTPGQPGRPPIVVIRDSSEEKRNASEAREREGLAVAAVLRDAVAGDDPWHVRDEETGELRPAIWRDVAILMPTRAGLEPYEDGLAAAGVPHRHEGARDYFQRQEIRDFVLLLAALDDPADRIASVGALRSSAFGCSDEELIKHAASKGIWDYRVGIESESAQVTEAQRLMAEWHRLRNRLSIGEFVSKVLAESRLVEFALTLPDGAQAAANLLAIGDRAREFAAAGGGGPRPFVRWLREHSERQQNEVDTGITEENDDVVRLMTMHGSKGLEYPIVVLANLANQPRGGSEPVPGEADHLVHFRVGTKSPGYYTTPGYDEEADHEKTLVEAESRRLLYVAATRARDHLIVPDLEADPSGGSTLAKLKPILPGGDGHEVQSGGVWLLDADQLDLPVPIEEEGPRDVAPTELDAADAEREQWESALDEASAGAQQELTISVASTERRERRPLAAEASHSAAAMLMSEGPPLEVGEALHLVMERVSLPKAKDLDEIAAAVCLEAGIAEHSEEVVELARRCLSSPIVREAMEAGNYQREVPFTTCTSDGFAVGRADLIFIRGDELVIVDYKTDFVTADNAASHAAEHHSDQARIYRDEFQESTGLECGAVVFVYCRAGVEVELGEMQRAGVD